MKKFEKNIDDRKKLATRLSELTGIKARYTFVPRCAYEVGPFIVEKDGCLTVEEGADESILQALISENLIGACIEETHPVSPAHTEQPEITPMQTFQPDFVTESLGEDNREEAETPADTNAGETEESEWVLDAEYDQEAEEESAASLGIRDAEETEAFPLDAGISFPLSKHTAASLTNLICMIHTRGPLISKATGGHFHADKDLVDAILDRNTFLRTEEVVSFVKEWDGSENGLVGISFDEEKVIFDGFTGVRDQEHLQAFMKLAAAMNRMAQTQKRVQAKDTDDSNEKYSLRVWLVRLGLNGPEYKAERKILMANLSGHAAFRTPADEEKWKARQNAKKVALKAAKAETSEAE